MWVMEPRHVPASQAGRLAQGWSLIYFACSGQSSYKGNIFRGGQSGNEKHGAEVPRG